MGLVDKIKADVKRSGQNKGKFIYFREGTAIRVRFLTDMDDGMEINFHDSFELSVNVPCQEHFGKDCSYCGGADLRHRSQYVWSVYNYESKEVQLMMFPVNNCTPVPALMAMFDNYGTLCDRDYVIKSEGKAQNKTFSVVPQDKVIFRNQKAKPFSEKAVLDFINKAWPDENSDEEFDEKPKSKSKSAKQKVDDYDDNWDNDYDEMTAKELYELCKEKGLDVPIKKPKEFYISILENFDESPKETADDWTDEDEEVEDYSDKTPRELYELCKERGIEVLPKKNEKYYINHLEENDKAKDDWGDGDDWSDDELPF